jgi:outer membrane lipoprotein SlyB
MRRTWVLSAILAALFLIGCTQKDTSEAAPDANAQHATVLMRDGSSVTGTVTASTPSQITLNTDNGGARTILIKDVRTVEYGDAANNAGSLPVTATPPTAAGSAPRPRPDRSTIKTTTFEIPAGTQVSVRNEELIDSSKTVEGQTYAAEVTNDVLDAKGAVVIPRGANAQLVIKSVSSGGRIRGASDLVIDLQSVSVDGQQYSISANDIVKEGKEGVGTNKRTAEYAGGGAALGAVIGAIAGQGKGAVIGGASGAGAGALAEILTKGGSVKVPAETLMTFKLDKPVRIVERR